MRVLVTGGSGFLGEQLLKDLLERDYEVINFDINKSNLSNNNLEFIEGDIRDTQLLSRTTKNIDIIFHCVVHVPIAKDKSLLWPVNYEGTKKLLEAAHQNHVSKVVNISTSAIYGVPKQLPVTENTEPTPIDKYGKAKYAGEELCESYRKKGLDISIIRPSTILGGGRLGIFQILFEWIYQGYNIPVLGNGHNIYQFIHCEDLSQACIAAGLSKKSDDFNIGAKETGSMREALEYLVEYADTGSKVKSVPMNLMIFLMRIANFLKVSPLGSYSTMMYGRSIYFDISHAEKKLDFSPKFSHNAIFKDTYNWYVNNRDDVLSGSFGANSENRSALNPKILSLLRYIL